MKRDEVKAAEDNYDFYRCYQCKRLLTKLDEDQAMNGDATICSCGSRKYSPSNPPDRWFEWLSPRVLRFVWARYRGVA